MDLLFDLGGFIFRIGFIHSPLSIMSDLIKIHPYLITGDLVKIHPHLDSREFLSPPHIGLDHEACLFLTVYKTPFKVFANPHLTERVSKYFEF